MNDLEFIKDKVLRKTLENSLQYIQALYNKSTKDETELYKEETHRVIVLYVISAIEAVLLYFYKESKEKMSCMEYKFVELLSKSYIHKEKDGFPVVVAIQEKMEKSEHQIGLRDLVVFFSKKKLMKEETANDILELNEIRNTFHFNKPRIKKCDINRVELALKLLVHTIERAPSALKNK